MATTGVDFVLLTKTGSGIQGSTVKATPFVMALEPNAARNVAGAVPGGAATGILGASGLPVNSNGILVGGFATQGFALNGAFHVTTTGTTAVSVDLTNLVTNSTSQAGDATFAKFNKIKVRNGGTGAMTIAPGASNPASLGLGGTTPTYTVNGGSEVEIEVPAGATVDATHKIITVTPTAGGDVVVAVGGG